MAQITVGIGTLERLANCGVAVVTRDAARLFRGGRRVLPEFSSVHGEQWEPGTDRASGERLVRAHRSRV